MKAIKSAALGLYGVIGLLVSMFGIKLPFAESFAKEHWRAGLSALSIVILMIPAFIGLFLYLVDANRFKAEIVQYVKVQTQRDLVLEGDLKVTFFPKFGLDSGKASLSQRNSAKEFASINNARLYIAWWPLFKKQLLLERVEIDGMRANVIRYKDGTTNYDDLLIRGKTLLPAAFDIEGVRITNSAIHWQDEIKWKRIALQDLQIETGRLAETVPSNFKASFQLNSEKLRSDSRVELKSHLLFNFNAGRYEFADFEGKLSGTVAGFSNLDLHFNGSVDSSIDRESLFHSLQAENLSISGAGNYGQRNMEGRLSLPKLQLAKGELKGSQLSINATVSQFDDKWVTEIQMPAFEFANQQFNAAEFSADFDFKGDGRTLQGKLSAPVKADLAAAPKLQFSAITLKFTATHPVIAGELKATSSGNLSADFGGGNANLDFKARIDDSKITGKLAIKDFIRPEYNFDLMANRLDLDHYISADWIKRYQNDAMQLDFSNIRKLALSGRLRVDEFKAAKFKATALAAGFKVEQDMLTIEPLAAKLYGGAYTGSLVMVASGTPQFSLKQNLKGIQTKELLADTALAGKYSGKGDIAIDLSAVGGSIGALRKSLNGTASVKLSRGTLSGIDLRSALLSGKDVVGMQGAERVFSMKSGEVTEFSGMKAAFNFKEGSSLGNSFELQSPLFRVIGGGEFAPGTGSVAYRLDATVAKVLKRGNELAELKDVTVPMRVSGHWETPSVVLDFSAASGDLVTKKIAARAAAELAAIKAAEQEVARAGQTETKAVATRAGKPIARKLVLKPVKK